jgi:hypothetical protein
VALSAFDNSSLVPCDTSAIDGATVFFLGLNIIHSRIFWEGNVCADKLVSYDHELEDSAW